MRPLISVSILGLIASPLWAAPTQDWSALIAQKGLAQTESVLAGLSEPTAEDLFALGMTRFLGGVEAGLQARWQVGQAEEGFLPVFRLPITPNPAPAPFDPALIETVLERLDARMDDARAALARIPAEGDVSLVLRPADLWFDINGSGNREDGEAILTVGESFLAQPSWNPETGQMVTPQMPAVDGIQFDRADISWLSAYTHLLSATSGIVRAFQPTPVIDRVMKGRMAMVEKGISGPLDLTFGARPDSYPNEIDMIAMLLLSLRQQPIPELTRSTRDHLLTMVAENRRFWTEVAAETDNEREWIPNSKQTSALGPAFPEGTDVAWLAVLDDAEKLLKGELLVPHFEFIVGTSNNTVTGFDLAAWMQEPAPVDLVEWLHGMGLEPWLKQGPIVTAQNLRAFEALVSGNGVLFAVWFN